MLRSLEWKVLKISHEIEIQKSFEPIENMHMRVCKFSSNEFAHLQKIDPPFILHNENSIKVTTILQFKVKDEKFNSEE